ncbi:UrcA family protein, partial [Synergistaceae bacterium OttesenSCG-928-I11]|nr:UrcA family protein [Synergistaceae bacterium OttesenSCG-928-I11]
MMNIELTFKKLLAVLAILLFSGIIPCTAAAAPTDKFPDAVAIWPIDYDNYKLYSEPDGKALDFRLEDAAEYFAEKHGAQWYKIVYCWPYGGSMLRQLNKLPDFDEKFVYISAGDVTTRPAKDYVKNQINWLRAGRPPRFKVGEVLKLGEGYGVDKRIIFVLKAPVTLLEEPKEGARKIEAPKGLKCLGPVYATEDDFPICHADMEEENWALIVDAATCQVLGWILKPQLHIHP